MEGGGKNTDWHYWSADDVYRSRLGALRDRPVNGQQLCWEAPEQTHSASSTRSKQTKISGSIWWTNTGGCGISNPIWEKRQRRAVICKLKNLFAETPLHVGQMWQSLTCLINGTIKTKTFIWHNFAGSWVTCILSRVCISILTSPNKTPSYVRRQSFLSISDSKQPKVRQYARKKLYLVRTRTLKQHWEREHTQPQKLL